jgi:hypothetical protein
VAKPPVAPDDTPTRLQREREQWLDAYIQGTQLPNGEYAHLLICSGDRSTPAGESGCVCAPRIKRLRAEVSRLREALQQREQLWSELNHRYSDLVHNGSPLVDAALDRAKVAEADVSRLQQENAALKADIQQIIDDREVNNESMAAHIRELEDELKNT